MARPADALTIDLEVELVAVRVMLKPKQDGQQDHQPVVASLLEVVVEHVRPARVEGAPQEHSDSGASDSGVRVPVCSGRREIDLLLAARPTRLRVRSPTERFFESSGGTTVVAECQITPERGVVNWVTIALPPPKLEERK